MSADTTQAQPEPAAEPEPLEPDEQASEDTEVVQAAEPVKPARPAGDILGQILDEHPGWPSLFGALPAEAMPAFLDHDSSDQAEFSQHVAANLAGYEADQQMLAAWNREAWARVIEDTRHVRVAA